MGTYSVKIIEARYDEEEGMLVIYGIFLHTNDRKIIVLAKTDISAIFKVPELSNDNMHYFAMCLSKRTDPIQLSIDDDPNRTIISEEEQMKYAMMFNKQIADELKQVSDGLSNEWGQVQRKLGRLAAEGKLDAMGLLKEELAVKKQLGIK